MGRKGATVALRTAPRRRPRGPSQGSARHPPVSHRHSRHLFTHIPEQLELLTSCLFLCMNTEVNDVTFIHTHEYSYCVLFKSIQGTSWHCHCMPAAECQYKLGRALKDYQCDALSPHLNTFITPTQSVRHSGHAALFPSAISSCRLWAHPAQTHWWPQGTII